VHIGGQPMPLPDILDGLKAGDIVTHILREPAVLNGIFAGDRSVLREVYVAQQRGVIFDVGHGAGSFAFEGAKRALDEGFRPNTISTDAYTHNIRGPVFDLPTTMSKLLALGMTLEEIIPRVTANPARVLAHCPSAAGIGTFHAGSDESTGDVSVLEVREGEFTFHDSRKQTLAATRRIVNVATVRAGELVWQEGREGAAG
jgi:dihydroorotase